MGSYGRTYYLGRSGLNSAAEAKRKRVNQSANNTVSRAGVWNLHHESFKAKIKVDYRLPDTTHLSDVGNTNFFEEIIQFMEQILTTVSLNLSSGFQKTSK